MSEDTQSNVNEVKYPVADDIISGFSDRFLPIKVNGPGDKKGAAEARVARLEVRQVRLDVEKHRKILKADALEWGQKVDGEARRLKGLLEPIELHLQEQEDIVRLHEERLAKEEEARVEAEKVAEAARIEQERAELLQMKAAQEAEANRLEQIRLDQEAEKQRIAAAELAVERSKLEAEKKAEKDKLDAAQLAIDVERARVERVAREDKAREQDRIDAENERIAKANRLLAEQEAKKLADEAERVRLEKEEAERLAALPDLEKAGAYLKTLLDVDLPAIEGEGKDMIGRVHSGIESYLAKVNSLLNEGQLEEAK